MRHAPQVLTDQLPALPSLPGSAVLVCVCRGVSVGSLRGLSEDQLMSVQVLLMERCGQREVYEACPLVFQVPTTTLLNTRSDRQGRVNPRSLGTAASSPGLVRQW